MLLAMAPGARADRAFAARFSANANGAVTMIGNTLETCPESAPACVPTRAGTGSMLNNNDFTMERVDVDQDPATFDSSSARLQLPAGARVLFAGPVLRGAHRCRDARQERAEQHGGRAGNG